MADTTAISITGIIVSGVAGPALGAYWTRRQWTVERKAKRVDVDLGELRSLFAECLKMMLDARLSVVQVQTAAERGSLDPLDDEVADEALAEKMLSARENVKQTQELVQVMLQEYPRLLLLLGSDHPVVDVFSRNTAAIKGVTDAALQITRGDVDRSVGLEAISAAQKSFTSAMAEFITVCSPIANRRAD